MEQKICSRCKLKKPIADFSARAREKSGFSPYCKDCHHLYYRSKHPEEKNKISTLDGEIWLSVVDYEGLYEVSSLGRVKSCDRNFINKNGRKIRRSGCILPQYPEKKRGYLRVNLCKDGIGLSPSVHRLVAIAFIPNPENKPEVNHKWGNKIDNRASQLEWATGGENRLHAYHVLGVRRPLQGKFGKDHHTSKPVNQLSLDGQLVKRWDSASDAQRAGLANRANISACCTGKTKTAKGFKWEYI